MILVGHNIAADMGYLKGLDGRALELPGGVCNPGVAYVDTCLIVRDDRAGVSDSCWNIRLRTGNAS